MKATLYSEEMQQCEPIDEHKLATASEKPAKAEPPRQEYYIVDYKPLKKATIIAAVILVVFAAALFIF